MKWVTGVRMWRPCQAWKAARRCSTQVVEPSKEPSEADQLRTGKRRLPIQKYGGQNDLNGCRNETLDQKNVEEL